MHLTVALHGQLHVCFIVTIKILTLSLNGIYMLYDSFDAVDVPFFFPEWVS